MSKQYQIKWRDKDVKELNRLVKNFNAKVRYHEQKNPATAEFLPDKLSAAALKGSVGTRADFNRLVSSLQRFGERGAETVVTTPGGVTTTKYEIAEVKNKVRIANIKRSIERKKLDLKPAKGTMGQVSSQNLRPKVFSMNKSEKEWEKFKESLEKEVASNFKNEMMEEYKQNYLDAIKNFLGEDGQALFDMISEMDPETVYQNSVTNPILSIGFTSDPLPTETIAGAAMDEWSNV